MIKTFLSTTLFMLIGVIGHSQISVYNMGRGTEHNRSVYVSAHTVDKDTLYLANNSLGKMIKEAWEVSDEKIEKPHIIFVDPNRLANFEVTRNDLIVNKENDL